MITDTVDDIFSTVGIPDDTSERFLTSAMFGGFMSKNRMAARALLRAVAIGCRIS